MFTLHPCCLCRLWVAYSDGDTEELPLAELMPLLQPPGPGDKEPGTQLEAEYQRSKAGSLEEVRSGAAESLSGAVSEGHTGMVACASGLASSAKGPQVHPAGAWGCAAGLGSSAGIDQACIVPKTWRRSGSTARPAPSAQTPRSALALRCLLLLHLRGTSAQNLMCPGRPCCS